jgi:DNA-directed RNA polymerase specialized sigma24 family protein
VTPVPAEPFAPARAVMAGSVGVPTGATAAPARAPGPATATATAVAAPPAAAEPTARSAPPAPAPGAGVAASDSAPPTADRPDVRPGLRRLPQLGRTPEEAFDRLYARASPSLVRQVELLTGDARCARQAVAHAYDLAWQRWPEVARDSDPVGWVRTAAYGYALAPWQRWMPGHRKRRPVPPGEPLEAALLGLPPAHRKAVLLHDGLGLGLPATAVQMEATAPAAAARVARAREALTAAVPGLDEATLPERLGALLDSEAGTEAKPEPGTEGAAPEPEAKPEPGTERPGPEGAERPLGVRDASERGVRRRTVGAFALTGLIAVATTVTVMFGPVDPDAPAPRHADPDPRASARAHVAREDDSRQHTAAPAPGPGTKPGTGTGTGTGSVQHDGAGPPPAGGGTRAVTR